MENAQTHNVCLMGAFTKSHNNRDIKSKVSYERRISTAIFTTERTLARKYDEIPQIYM